MSGGKEKDKTIMLAVGAGIGTVVLWLVAGLVQSAMFADWQTRGQFGDMFGTINSLFSGLAFAGVIVAIILQRQELQLQRRQLEETRKELSRSAKAAEDARELERRRLYDQARYDAWVRAAGAIEAYRKWAREWWRHAEHAGRGGGLGRLDEHLKDPRRTVRPAIETANELFPGLSAAFEGHLQEETAIVKTDPLQEQHPKINRLYVDMGKTYQQLRARVTREMFSEFMTQPADTTGGKEDTNEQGTS